MVNNTKKKPHFSHEVVGSFVSYLDGRGTLEANETLAEMFNYSSSDDLIQHLICRDHYADPEARGKFVKLLNDHGRVSCFQSRMIRSDGSRFWVEMHAKLIPDKKLIEGIMIDITDRAESDEMLKSSLQEKDLFIKEIHHRVKNNLANIQGMLHIQASREQDNSKSLIEAANRIRTISVLHDKLQSSPGQMQTDAAEYIKSLIKCVCRNDGTCAPGIKIQFDLDTFNVSARQLVPIGLIVNELACNAFKHAFPQTNAGTVKISLKKQADTLVTLIVSDNGIGMPDEMQHSTKGSLGLEIVAALASQIDGKFEIDSTNGTTATITFNLLRA